MRVEGLRMKILARSGLLFADVGSDSGCRGNHEGPLRTWPDVVDAPRKNDEHLLRSVFYRALGDAQATQRAPHEFVVLGDGRAESLTRGKRVNPNRRLLGLHLAPPRFRRPLTPW